MGSAAQRASLPTVLIVEDEFLPRAMLSDHLQECGFMVFDAGSADEAITMSLEEEDRVLDEMRACRG
jgi:DNA-binding response OmpR family regulator